jgi:hypothetical protein
MCKRILKARNHHLKRLKSVDLCFDMSYMQTEKKDRCFTAYARCTHDNILLHMTEQARLGLRMLVADPRTQGILNMRTDEIYPHVSALVLNYMGEVGRSPGTRVTFYQGNEEIPFHVFLHRVHAHWSSVREFQKECKVPRR